METKQIYRFKKSYTDILSEFKELNPFEKERVIVEARNVMKMNGIEESGTLDIQNAVVDVYRMQGSFQEFLEKELEFQHAGYYSEL